MKKTVYGFITGLAAFVLGAGFYACEQPGGVVDNSSPDTVAFVAVTNITLPEVTGVAGTAIDLSKAAVVPSNATHQTIVWTVTNAGTTGVTQGTVTGNTIMPQAAGTLTLTATMAKGKTNGTEDYTKTFTIAVATPFVAVTGISGVSATGTAICPVQK
jgi:endo-1,4-beta-xylanase